MVRLPRRCAVARWPVDRLCNGGVWAQRNLPSAVPGARPPRACLDRRESRRRVGERELRKEAARLEKAGSFDRAALRHLWLEDREEASRRLEKVPINDDNLYCNQSAGRWREAVEYLARMERPLDAARIALGANDLGRALELIRKSGDLEEGADLLESFRHFSAGPWS